MVRHGQHDGIDVRPLHQFAIIVIRLAILILVTPVNGIDHGGQMLLIHVADGDDAAILLIEKGLGIAGALSAGTDHAEIDFIGRTRDAFLRRGAAGDKGGHGQRGAGCKKTAATDP
jgi:hypothetical protein